jgi:L-fuculose-phosphate aldolase
MQHFWLHSHSCAALGPTLAGALRLAAEVETIASQYWHASQLGAPHVLDHDALERVRRRFAEYGQPRRPRRPT